MEQYLLDDKQCQDLQNIICGVYSPLRGFLCERDYRRVLEDMRLVGGELWPIPIVLDFDLKDINRFSVPKEILLVDTNGNRIARLVNFEIYKHDKTEHAQKVFGTLDDNHPGVKQVFSMNDYLLGGEVEPVSSQRVLEKKSPAYIKDIFNIRGWKTVVAFQTRNAPHLSHEYLQKLALEGVDGLFIQPVIGRKKPGDFKDEVIIDTYKLILDKYYPKNRVHFDVLPLAMRYAGPREAVFHALIRKNFGCTHMIIGRDHAGVGNYYDPYGAHKIFDHFAEDELGIKIMKFENAFHCNDCKGLVTADKCPHPKESRIFLSGTQIRQMIRNREKPEEFMRKEVSEYLINHSNPFV